MSPTTPTSGANQSPIVFFGTEPFALTSKILLALIENDYTIAAVVTKPDSVQGRGHKLTPPAIKQLAEQHNIPVWQPAKVGDIHDDIAAVQPVAGVLVSYGAIIPVSILELFTPGIINVHPSLLPRLRGPSPIETAIADRDRATGVSLMKLANKMDAGPVYAQSAYVLDHQETRPELYDTLGQLGASLLATHLPTILDGSLIPYAQKDDEATYCQLLSKADGVLDPETITPGEAEARIRAYQGALRCRISRSDVTDLIITKAHVVLQSEDELDIAFSNGAYLSIDELVTPNGRTMTADAYLRGRK